MRYSPERKEAVLKKMMPPHNRTIRQLAVEEGISEATLYNWHQQARTKGIFSEALARIEAVFADSLPLPPTLYVVVAGVKCIPVLIYFVIN